MTGSPRCPRCGEALLPPTVMHERFECSRHGPVAPLHDPVLPGPEALATLAKCSDVPFWLPWPLPATWVFTGLRLVGGGKEPVEAVVIGLTGRGLTQGPSDLLIVAEQPGTGLGAALAGTTEPDPDLTTSAAVTKIRAAGYQTPLWSLESPDRAAYVGEAAGQWLWLVAWPQASWAVVDDDLQLVDLRGTGALADLPTGALMPRLAS